MHLMKMKYKNFEFPLNPYLIKVKHSRNIAENPIIDSDSAVYNVSKNASVISGEGCFFGEKAFDFASELERLSKSDSSGWLFIPSGNCFDAYLKDLTIKSDAKRSEVFYSFTFIENCNHSNNQREIDFIYANKDENFFDIANRCEIPIEKLLELNNRKNPFDIYDGDKVVLR